MRTKKDVTSPAQAISQPPIPKTPDTNNYWFLLKCLSAVAAAAVVGASIAAMCASKSAALVGSSFALKALATTVVVSTPWLIPALGAVVLLALCFSPCLLSSSSSRAATAATSYHGFTRHTRSEPPLGGGSSFFRSQTFTHPPATASSVHSHTMFSSQPSSHGHPSNRAPYGGNPPPSYAEHVATHGHTPFR